MELYREYLHFLLQFIFATSVNAGYEYFKNRATHHNITIGADTGGLEDVN